MGQAAEVIVEELVLALVGLSAGAAVAGGLFSFIVELGVIADFADLYLQYDQSVCDGERYE